MYTLTLFVCASIFLVLSTKITHGATDPAYDTKLNNIDTQIQQKQKELTDIEDKIEFYNKTIEVKQEELLSLKSEQKYSSWSWKYRNSNKKSKPMKGKSSYKKEASRTR